MTISDTNTRERARASLTRTTFYLLFGPIVWAIHLTVLYGAHTLVCVHGAAGDTVAAIALAATVAAVALLLAAAFAFYRRRDSAHTGASAVTCFCRDVAMLLALVSAFGVAWAGATALIVAPCVALR